MSEDIKTQAEQLQKLLTRLVSSLQSDAESGDVNATSHLALAELISDKLDDLSSGIIEHVGTSGPDREDQEV